MMKTIYFVRHGKSSWDNPYLGDHERPLKKRGRRDAEMISGILKDRGVNPELILTSDSSRTLETAAIFAETLDIDIVIEKVGLYLADYENILDVIRQIDDKYTILMIFGHNPAYTELANLISRDTIINVPTCGLFEVRFEIKSWREIDINNGRMLDKLFPKIFR